MKNGYEHHTGYPRTSHPRNWGPELIKQHSVWLHTSHTKIVACESTECKIIGGIGLLCVAKPFL